MKTKKKSYSFPSTLLSEFGISYSNILPRYNQNQYKNIIIEIHKLN